MYWKDLEKEFWDALKKRKSRSPSMAITEELIGDKPSDYYLSIFISHDGTFHLLSSFSEKNRKQLLDPKVKGLKIGYLSDLLVTERERQDYIDLQCSVRPHLTSFTSVIKDISRLIFEDNYEPIDAINITIKRWRSFWGNIRENVLSESEQLGLFGELFFLSFFIENKNSFEVKSWIGPESAVHDFEFNKTSVEIKTTLKNRHEHVIHGIEQLANIGSKDLYLISIRATKNSDTGQSIVELKNKISLIFDELPDEYELFMKKLSSYGYNPEHEIEYNELKFSPIDIRAFKIIKEFPKLIPESFVHILPSNISDISYSLNLEGLNYFTLKSSIEIIQ